ncbi:ribosome maturation factor RimM [Desulfobotulus sp.]|uniref:ribosome maturation factor RimM n=1 Tax=Desulfobotulus sp. TaxID=1940337 RepID=UPI002A35B001|nr:ribosome maturation factor RimM [Desulfobotulus sp.]MDY0163121.1 ribosome maturation factor RimM [Desulfobotulus sp.]
MKAVRIGKIVGVHGLAGNLKVYSDAESLEVYTDCGPLWIREKKGVDPNQAFRVRHVQVHKGPVLLLRLEGIEDCTAAETLVGGVIYADRNRFPEPEEGYYYWSDLIGLELRTPEGRHLGYIRRIMEAGGHEIFEVSGNGREFMVPAHASVVSAVFPDEGYMTVELPEGLLDL